MALLASADVVTGARRWLRQRSQEGLKSAGWWKLSGKAPVGWPNSGWEEQAPTQLEKLPGRDGPPPLSSTAAWAMQSPGAGSGPGEMAANSGCWEAWKRRAGGCITLTLLEPVAGSFYCFSAAFESGEEKRTGLKSTLKSRAGRSARVSQQPPPAASACQLCLPMLPWPCRRCCQRGGCFPRAPVLQQGVGITIWTPQGAGNGALPPQPPKSLQPQGPELAAARNLPNHPAPTDVGFHPFPVPFAQG